MGGMVRRWHFNPYHQRIDESLEKDPGEVRADTEWPAWHVFRQPKRGEAHVLVGMVHAPDAETALLLAKEQYARREDCVNLWVVRTDQVHATSYEDADMFEFVSDRTYRLTRGFPVGEKLKKIKAGDPYAERLETLEEIEKEHAGKKIPQEASGDGSD